MLSLVTGVSDCPKQHQLPRLKENLSSVVRSFVQRSAFIMATCSTLLSMILNRHLVHSESLVWCTVSALIDARRRGMPAPRWRAIDGGHQGRIDRCDLCYLNCREEGEKEREVCGLAPTRIEPKQNCFFPLPFIEIKLTHTCRCLSRSLSQKGKRGLGGWSNTLAG